MSKTRIRAVDRIVCFSGEFHTDADGNRCRTSTWLFAASVCYVPDSGRYGGICNENHEYQLSV